MADDASLIAVAYRALEAARLPRVDLVRFTVGLSGAHVLRAGEAVLKIVMPGAPHRERLLLDEIAALRWLHSRICVPDVLWTGSIEDHAILAMEMLPGHPLYEHPPAAHADGLAAIVRTLAALHALQVADCPRDQCIAAKIAEAAVNVADGVVDESDFDDEHAGLTAGALLEQLLARQPTGSGAVAMTHGDACFPNFLLDDDGAVGLIDVGRAGVGDPYQDFALFLRSAAFNFPTLDARAILMREYPLTTLDDERLSFFRLLDEFF